MQRKMLCYYFHRDKPFFKYDRIGICFYPHPDRFAAAGRGAPVENYMRCYRACYLLHPDDRDERLVKETDE